MTQPDLFSDEPKRAKKAVNVPATSVAAYRMLDSGTRTADVLRWLRYGGTSPTSAELAKATFKGDGYTDHVLYVRRGLSDALAKGFVEHAGKRRCTVAGTLALTWKIRSR